MCAHVFVSNHLNKSMHGKVGLAAVYLFDGRKGNKGVRRKREKWVENHVGRTEEHGQRVVTE